MMYRSRASKLRLAFEELGPTFVKLGQMLSKRPDLVPRTYVIELEKLQDKVQPLEFNKMRESFESECICSLYKGEGHDPTCYHCNDILEIFDEFDTRPFASASIGQVYQGVLNGTKVAIKIARPNLIDTINLDLEIIKDLKPIIIKTLGVGNNFDADAFINEFKEMLHRELDYRTEAMNMKRFHENFKDVKDVHIPQVHMDYCRENVLVMDFMEGTQVKDLANVDQKMLSKYAHLISSSYLKQVYQDGFYHADPHGGNILVQDGAIAFIDFGAVGKIEGELRRNMLNLFYAIHRRNVDMASDAFLKIGNINEDDVDIHRFKWDLDELISKQYHGVGERQSDNYAMLALKYNMSLPSEYSTLERALILVEAVCLKLDPKYNLMDEAKPLIYNAMKERYSPRRAAEYMQLEGDEYMEIFKNLPAGINDVIETIRGYRIEKLEAKTKQIKRYHMTDMVLRYVSLVVIMIISTYLAVNGNGTLPTLGTIGFAIGVFLFGMLAIRRN